MAKTPENHGQALADLLSALEADARAAKLHSGAALGPDWRDYLGPHTGNVIDQLTKGKRHG